MSWVLNAYTVVYAAMLIPAGGLADTHGRKRVFLLGVALFIAASAACGLAGSVGWLIAARVLQAVGAALLTPASLSIVLAAFPQSKRARDREPVGRGGRLRGRGRARASARSSSRPSAGRGRSSSTCRSARLSLWRGASLLRESDRAARAAASTASAWRCSWSRSARSRSPSSKRNRRAGPARELLRSGAAPALIALVAFVVWARSVREPLVDLASVPQPDLQRGERGHADVRHRVRDDVLRFFFYMGNVWHYSLAQAGLAIAPGPLTVIPVAIVTGASPARFGHRPFLVGGALLYAGGRALVPARAG